MNDDNDDLAGVRDLHATLDDAIETLAMFLSAAANAQIPAVSLIDTAHLVVSDLVEWRATLQAIAERQEEGGGLQ